MTGRRGVWHGCHTPLNRPRRTFAAATIIACAAQASAQSDSTTSTHQLDATVVVAHRIATDLRASTAAVSVITRADLERTQARMLPDALRFVPGLLFSSRDGGGSLPLVIARGFFGGGENEYVLLMVDGIPVNTTRTSLVEWTSIPVAVIERIELFRGSGSVLYGDAAIGGVINVITRAPTSDALHTALGIAEHGAWDAALGAAQTLGGAWGATGTASYAAGRSNREHTFSRRLAAFTSVDKTLPPRRTRLAIHYNRLEDEDPGPLDDATASADPARANQLFHSDERTRDAAELTGIFDFPLGPSRMFHVAARVRGSRQGRTRTLLLAPSFGDTQFHHETDQGVWLRVQSDQLGGASKGIVGLEVSEAAYESSYRSPETGEELSNSSGSRLALALYTELQIQPAARLRLSGGGRYDRVMPNATLNGRDEDATFGALSGRVGINYGYRDGDNDAGNVYLVLSTGFKAPTLDQLYDSRRTPVGDGNTITISNPSLQPQRSYEVEGGVFQRVPMARSSLEISLSAYRRHLEDEIDFDLATFRYGNIKRSRHESVELLTLAHLWRNIEAQNALTLGRAVFRSGPYQGYQLKNLPRFSSQTAVSAPVLANVMLTLAHTATSRTYLDDENTTAVRGVNLFDAGLRLVAGSVEGSIRVENLADERAAMLGFLLYDPTSMRNVPMVYPMGGRTIRVALKIDR